MGLSWITVLKAVPWTEVVRNAPAVAEGARKLWESARKKAPPPAPPEPAAAPAPAGAEEDPLAPRVAALQAQNDELRRQMAESGELINALASQNTELIRRVDALQKRQRQLALALAVLALIIIGVAARL